MHQFTTYELLMTLGTVTGWTVALMQFFFRVQIKDLKIWILEKLQYAINKHKLDCAKDFEQ